MRSLSILSLIFLAACSQGGSGVGVTGSSSTSSDQKTNDSLSRIQDLKAGNDMKATRTMPASLLIAGALSEFGALPTGPSLARMRKMNQPRDLARLVNFATSPSTGWPADPESGAGIAHMRAMAAAVEFSQEVFAALATRVNERALQDETRTRAAILEEFNSFNGQAMADLLESKIYEAGKGNPTADLTGKDGVQFTLNGKRYEFTPAGAVIKVAGGVQFGDGHIGGKKIELALADTLGATLTAKRDLGSSQSVSQGSKADATVGVK